MSTVNIFSRFFNKGFKDAEAALTRNDKRTKYWAKKQAKYYAAATAAATYYAQKALRLSIQEALADERSQRILATTLKNVAFATDTTIASTEAQIRAMQSAYGVADDQLRPALARLVRSTGSVSEAFTGLNLALDISSATGKSLESVTAALGKAYDGNYASLQRLGLGLDASLLATKDQKKIMESLRGTFSGFARKEAATTEGSFRRIKTAAKEASEIIGKSLVDAVVKFADAGGNNVDTFTKKINRMSEGLAETIDQLSTLAAEANTPAAKKLPWYLDIGTTIRNLLWSQTIFAFLNRQGDERIAKQKKAADLALLEQKRTEFSVKNRQSELRLANYLLNKRIEESKVKPPAADPKTLEQLMAEEAARKAGFKLTEDLDSIQTVAAAKRLEESRQYKMSVLDAAQSQFEAIKNNYDLLNAVWTTQLAAFDVFLAALKTKAKANPIGLDLYSTYIGSGAAGMAPMAPPTQSNYFGFEDPLSLSMGYNQGSVSGAAQPSIVVNVNAGIIAEQERLVSEIASAVTQNYRYGNSLYPAGYLP